MDGTVILADDDKNLRSILGQSLTRAGAKVRTTATISTLWRWLEEGEGDVVLCDVNLADGDAIDELPKMRALRPDLQFVLMSAQNTVITALRATEAGAFDYLAKPFDLREMIETLMRAQSQPVQSDLQSTDNDTMLDLPLIGRSEPMQELYRQLSRVIASDLPVLIIGDVGTGKTLLGEVIHRFGDRKSAPLIRYDGANFQDQSARFVFEESQNGTLFLEKIEDFLPSEQREILQLIESGNYDSRIIATASYQVEKAVEEGALRADFYHQINVLSLKLPNLNERNEDIEELARAFVLEESQANKTISPEAIERLKSKYWPGNIRELRAAIRRLITMGSSNQIQTSDIDEFLPALRDEQEAPMEWEASFSQAVEAYIRRFIKLHGKELPPHGLYEEVIDAVDRPLIEVVLEITGGNQVKTAEILGINRNTLRKKINNLDISVRKSKKLMQ